MNIPDLTITSLETITLFDYSTGAFWVRLDELQNSTIAQGQEKTDITGRGGRKLSSLKRNKTVTVSGTNGIVSSGLMEVQTGGKFEEKNTEVMWIDHLTVSSNEATTSYKAVGTTGNEIAHVYKRNSDGTLGDEFTQAASAEEAGKFAYAPATKKLTFHTGDIADNTEIVVYYKRKINAAVLENNSDEYSCVCKMYIDALAEDICNNVYRLQFYVPKADFSGEFSLELGDNQTVQAFEAEGLAGGCNANGTLWTYTVFGANAEDVE